MTEQFYKTAKGHEEPYAVQFSVFLANRVGQLKELAELFANKAVQIAGLSIVDSTDWAVVRLVATDTDQARHVLSAHSLPFTESHVLLVEVSDEASLSKLCTHLLAAEISVHFAYPLTVRSHENPVMVFHVDDHILATQILRNHNFTLLGHEDLEAEEEGG